MQGNRAAHCGLWIAALLGGGCVARVDDSASVSERAAVGPRPAVDLRADVSCPYDSFDCNPAVDDVAGQLAALRGHGAALGFHLGAMADPSSSHHFQSIQRVPGEASNYLLLTRSTERPADADLDVVRLASRDHDGGRLRSNRLDPARAVGDTAPPLSDRGVTSVAASTAHTHAGGSQLMGRILAVPLESGEPGSQVELFDVSDPEHPGSLGLIAHQVDGADQRDAGTASLARLADGRFLLVIGRRGASTLDFYVSTSRDIVATDWALIDSWHQSELRSTIGDRNFGSYQNLQLVAGQDGVLYLVGLHNRGLVSTDDWVDLFALDNPALDTGATDVVITKIAKRHLDCDRGGRQCNLDAGGGIYVDPEGKLILYAVEHDNDGPPPPGFADPTAGSVKLMEFNAPYPSDACGDDPDRAFVELYEDHDFSGRSIILDRVDRGLEDLEHLGTVDGFEDRASSVRWCLPPGVRVRLYRNKSPCGGDGIDLTGRGDLDLETVGLGDRASCARWLSD